ncbi:MAG TPA: hypothetical protein VMZ71_02230 [Gemmataceae bacterium]|nr:hypothetical protein [Gemmataceae bacterium]
MKLKETKPMCRFELADPATGKALSVNMPLSVALELAEAIRQAERDWMYCDHEAEVKEVDATPFHLRSVDRNSAVYPAAVFDAPDACRRERQAVSPLFPPRAA